MLRQYKRYGLFQGRTPQFYVYNYNYLTNQLLLLNLLRRQRDEDENFFDLETCVERQRRSL